MATVDKAFADKIAAANGVLYPDVPFEPPVTRVVEYTNAWGGKGYGITFEREDPDKYLRPTEYIINPRIYWEKK